MSTFEEKVFFDISFACLTCLFCETCRKMFFPKFGLFLIAVSLYNALGSCPSLILFQPNFETFLLYIADISWNGNDEIPLCIRSRKRASRGSTNYPPPAVDEFLRNLIKFPVWVFDIYGAERPAYCMQDSFHCDNF
ncbi:hypothetical protein T4D_7184 [Trichinella pseudospiralis]|uniref:Uncharacterized protein n=1 Tax=Trichinella pseudospiralis TaxID=6337 RepID=A0A0V1F221_TRIPS|nr:hypothetical protein T4D_7184 [Trichinella pseudospiralis]